MVLDFSGNAKKETAAREFCIAMNREFGVRTKHFKAATPKEYRQEAEGIIPVLEFDAIKALM
jgi:hypothetical protein